MGSPPASPYSSASQKRQMVTSLAPGLSSPGQAAIASPSWHQWARGQADGTKNQDFVSALIWRLSPHRTRLLLMVWT